MNKKLLNILYFIFLIFFMPFQMVFLYSMLSFANGWNFISIFCFYVILTFLFALIIIVFAVIKAYRLFHTKKENNLDVKEMIFVNLGNLFYYIVFIFINGLFINFIFLRDDYAFFLKYPMVNNIIILNYLILLIAYILNFITNFIYIKNLYSLNKINLLLFIICLIISFFPGLNILYLIFLIIKKEG